MLFDRVLANNIIISCFFFFFLIIGLYNLIPAFTGQIFNATAKHGMPIGIPTKDARDEIETYPITIEANSVQVFNIDKTWANFFCVSYSSNHFALLHQYFCCLIMF